MRVAVIGCGTIAQIMHLPYLAELPGPEVDSLVDPAVERRETLGDRYGVDHRYTDTEELLEERAEVLDAVVVCTPSHVHADVVTQTLDAGIDTLVEKPLATDPADADRMVDAAAESEAVAMVAYMKRYDPAYERAAEMLDDVDEIDLVTAYDVDPDHRRIIDEVYNIVYGEFPDELLEESAATRRERIEKAIGTDDDALIDAYDFQIEHVCHDVNALRGLFGEVETIESVDVFADSRYATATLHYEGDIRCVLETGDSDRKWFEQWIRADTPAGRYVVDFTNPFIRNSPTELRVKRGIETLEETTHTPSTEEPFKREVDHFLDCVRGDATVRTTFAEAAADVRLIADLFREYRGANRIDR